MEYIPCKKLAEEFEEHLSKEDNQNILFSGKFGSGKTTFLKRYFDDHNDKYETIHLYPVNYSISSNEDIFKLVTADIAGELLSRELVSTNEKFQESLKSVIKSEKIWDLLEALPKVGKVIKFGNTAKDILTDIKNPESDVDKVKTYLDTISSNDPVKEIITQALSNICDDKEKVLVIDDLDRIDPEHLFRILNVLTAYCDNNIGLGFDKIILVCDIENVRTIFHHRYGPEADFYGYISKFYSKGFFRFSLVDQIEKRIRKVLLKSLSNVLGLEYMVVLLDFSDFIFQLGIVSMLDIHLFTQNDLSYILHTRLKPFHDDDAAVDRTIVTIAAYIYALFQYDKGKTFLAIEKYGQSSKSRLPSESSVIFDRLLIGHALDRLVQDRFRNNTYEIKYEKDAKYTCQYNVQMEGPPGDCYLQSKITEWIKPFNTKQDQVNFGPLNEAEIEEAKKSMIAKLFTISMQNIIKHLPEHNP